MLLTIGIPENSNTTEAQVKDLSFKSMKMIEFLKEEVSKPFFFFLNQGNTNKKSEEMKKSLKESQEKKTV
jgi:hypothetical protein